MKTQKQILRALVLLLFMITMSVVMVNCSKVKDEQFVPDQKPELKSEGEYQAETAFAYGCDFATCYLEIPNEKFKRWGWTNGPLNDFGTYTFDIYAAAGQCELTNGTLVGDLIVEYDGSTAIVTYNTCGEYLLDEIHLFVGNEILPRDKHGDFTIANGKFPVKEEDINSNTYTHTLENLSGPIYVVAHAVVIGDYTQGDCGEEGCDFEPLCTPQWSWADFSSLPKYYSGPEAITYGDGKTMTIEIANNSNIPTIQFDGGTIEDPFFLDEHSVYENINDIDYKRFRTRAASAEGNFNNAAPNSYTMTWTFSSALDHTNFFVVGQLLHGNVATITAYAPDMTTVVNNYLTFEQLDAEKITPSKTYTFYEPLSWTASTGVLKKNTTDGSNSRYGFFSIPEGTQIEKIVITLVDDGSRGNTSDEVNFGIGYYGCPQ